MSDEQSIRDEMVDRINDELDKWGEGSPSPYAIADAISPVIRRIQAEAIREAAEVFESGTVEHDEIKYSSDAPLGWTDVSVVDAVMSSGPVMDWLRGRADRIERGETA